MHENSPCRVPEIEDDIEEIELDNDIPPDDIDDDDDEFDMEEVTFEELQRRLEREEEEEEEGDYLDGEDITNEDVPDEAKLTFKEHLAPVFTCHQHPTLQLAITGGEDDRAYIWDTEDGKLVFTIDGHTDTVISARFSHDGRYVATGDMNGDIFVYKIIENNDAFEAVADGAGGSDSAASATALQFKQVWTYSMGDMAWMKWHFASHILIAGSDNGEIYFWRMPSGDCKVLPSTGGRCEIGEWSNDGKKLFAIYSDFKLKLWDLKACKVLFEVDTDHPLGHKADIVAIACDRDTPVYVSGDTNGQIVICTNNGPVNMHKLDDSIECLAFSTSTDLKLFASGCINGKVVIWDYSKNTMRCICEKTTETNDGIPTMIWLDEYTLLAGTLKGRINAFDARTGQVKFSLSGHVAHIYELHFKGATNTILSVSEDMTAKLFAVPYYGE